MSSVTFSGPYIKVCGILESQRGISFSSHVPLCNAEYFMTSKEALELYDKMSAVAIANDNNNDMDTELLKFTTLLREQLKKLDNPQNKDVWVCKLSQSSCYFEKIVLVHPTENEKVTNWMNGTWESFVQEIKYNPMFGGSEYMRAKHHFEDNKE